jgi:hypothetical protein
MKKGNKMRKGKLRVAKLRMAKSLKDVSSIIAESNYSMELKKKNGAERGSGIKLQF